jgi:hypothetical protein
MKKEKYIALVDKAYEDLKTFSTAKIDSISALFNSDPELGEDDRQEILVHMAKTALGIINGHFMGKIDGLIADPLASSSEIDAAVEEYESAWDSIEEAAKASRDNKHKERYKLN